MNPQPVVADVPRPSHRATIPGVRKTSLADSSLIGAANALPISVPVALGTSRFVESLLFGMKPNDRLTLAAAISPGRHTSGRVPARAEGATGSTL